MKDLTCCLVTPSYAKDFRRCELLCQSIKKFSASPINHYIIVDRNDYKLFQQLETNTTHVLVKEKLLPWWIQKVPIVPQNVWVSLKLFVIRGWVLQQLIKIAIAHYVTEDILCFVDSDVCFIKTFYPSSFVSDGKARFYRKPTCISADMKQGHYSWYKTATDLLKLPEVEFPASDYINQIVVWRRDIVLKLCSALEEKSGKDWLTLLSSSWHLSEYVLYGVFLDEFLKEDSGHYFTNTDLCFNYFSDEYLSQDKVLAMLRKIPDDRIALMISAKSGIPVDYYSHCVLGDKP